MIEIATQPQWQIPATLAEAAARLAAFAQQLSPWEAIVVGAYLFVMAVLSVYGLHRAYLVALYFQHADRAAQDVAPPANLPRVLVQLPLYNEPYVVEELLAAVSRLDYPRDRLHIQVLDDSTDQTTVLARPAVNRLADSGLQIELVHRSDRAGYKAGALAAGLAQSDAPLVALFDADFLPDPDFLLRTVGVFSDPQVGAVQARWSFSNRNASLLTRVQGMLLDAHFVFEQGGRSRSGRFFNFNGTAGVLRRQMIEDAGGWQHDTLTEDTDLSYRAQLRGWRYIYLQNVAVPSELPDDVPSFHVQQARWAKGLVQTGLKLLPSVFRARVPAAIKSEAFFHLTANISYPLMTLLAALLVPATVIRFNGPEPWLILLDAPVFLATFGSMASFYLLSRRQLTGRVTWGDALLFPATLAAGIGLTISNTQAVLEALLRIQTPFQRTAKRIYQVDANRLPWANLAAGLYFLAGFLYTAAIGNWPLLPFLALFVAGFLWAAFPSRATNPAAPYLRPPSYAPLPPSEPRL